MSRARLDASPLVEGLSYRQLDYWTTKGWLQAEQTHPGSGRARTWPASERRVARLMVRLITAGLTPAAAAGAARALDEQGRTELAPGVTVVVTT